MGGGEETWHGPIRARPPTHPAALLALLGGRICTWGSEGGEVPL